MLKISKRSARDQGRESEVDKAARGSSGIEGTSAERLGVYMLMRDECPGFLPAQVEKGVGVLFG